jgi:hypothetical protein
MAKYKLASEKLNVGGGIGKIRPTTITSGAVGVGNVRPSSINVNAARQTSTPMPVPDIIVDKSLQAAAGAADQVTKAAFRYQERKDQAAADELVLNYNARLRDSFIGVPDEDGRIQGGYANTKLNEAVTAFSEYSAGIDKLFVDSLNSVGDSVKSKAMLRMSESRDRYRNNASSHNVQQFNLYERDIQYKKKNELLQNISDEGVTPWRDGRVADFLKALPSEKDRGADIDFLATNTLQGAYNAALEAANKDTTDLTPTATAYDETKRTFEGIRGQLPEDVESKLEYWMEGRRSSSLRAANAMAKEREDRRVAEIKSVAPTQIAQTILANNFDNLVTDIEMFRSVFKDQNKASTAVVSAIEDAMLISVQSVNGPRAAKNAMATEIWNNIQEAGVSLNPLEEMKLQDYATVDIPERLYKAQDRKDNNDLIQYKSYMNAMTAKEQIATPISPPVDMLQSNLDLWNTVAKTQEDNVTRASDGSTKSSRALRTAEYALVLQDRPLTNSEWTKLSQSYFRNEIEEEHMTLLREQQQKMKNGTAVVPDYQKTTEYKTAKEKITASSFSLMGRPKPKSSDKEYRKDPAKFAAAEEAWKIEEAQLQYLARKDLNAKARDLGDKFDHSVWYVNYMKNHANLGNITTQQSSGVGFADAIFRTLTAPTMTAKVALDAFEGIGHFVTGQDLAPITTPVVNGEE